MYYQDICKEHNIVDDHDSRIIWFKQCLQLLEKKIIKLECKLVAFPFKIGCGLAGGNWNQYKSIITEWSQQYKYDLKVIFVKKSNVW